MIMEEKTNLDRVYKWEEENTWIGNSKNTGSGTNNAFFITDFYYKLICM